MPRMLDGGHSITRVSQLRNKPFNQGRFATVGAANKTQNGRCHDEACTPFYEVEICQIASVTDGKYVVCLLKIP